MTALATIGDALFANAAEAFVWLSQYQGRKAEIARDLVQVAYTTPMPKEMHAEDPQPV